MKWLQPLCLEMLQVLRRVGALLLVIAVLSDWCEQILTQHLESEMASLQGASSWIWVYGGGSILLSILNPVLVSLLVIAALVPGSLLHTLQRHFSPLFKESLRVMGQSLSWGLLLLVPGIVRFLQLAFVPFVVLLDSDYVQGRKDALRESSRLVRPQFWRILVVFVVFSILLPLVLTSWDEWSIYHQHPLLAVLLSAINALLSAAFTLVLLAMWRQARALARP